MLKAMTITTALFAFVLWTRITIVIALTAGIGINIVAGRLSGASVFIFDGVGPKPPNAGAFTSWTQLILLRDFEILS